MDNIYCILTGLRQHKISLSEVLGRLVYCGFDIIDHSCINNLTYFIVRKKGDPAVHKYSSCFPLIKLERIGRNKEMMKMIKIRTMHPYAEYIHDYIIRKYGYNNNGKPANDFRVADWGRLLRRTWLDELPQLLYLFTGRMKLVGVRPLSVVRFNEFPDDLKKERVQYKPGCIPPYVALCMPDEKGCIEAERIYLNSYKKHPFLTDLRYFIMAAFNILCNRVHSS